MSATFYRKYRPDRFADVIGQETAVTVLTQSLLKDKVSHAYLLTGPRGTGKTTLARLFAAALNCSKRKKAEPCGTCPHCLAIKNHQALDIIEIDAASHTGVDNIRELKDTISTAPVLGQYKVYIIDEAHMLSIGAWNALLKTLEEPPAHVVFMMATTNIGKVPETILSRALRLDLKRFPLDQLVAKLGKIAKAEKIDIDDESLLLIARSAQGGMRDAEVLFTQMATLEEPPIRIDRTTLLLGATTTSTLANLLKAISEKDHETALRIIRELGEQGINMSHFSEHLLQYLRHALYLSVDTTGTISLEADFTESERAELAHLATALGSERIVECLERFQEAEAAMKYSPIPELPFEIAIVKLITLVRGELSVSTSNTPPSPTTPASPANRPSQPSPREVPTPSQPKAVATQPSVAKDTAPVDTSSLAKVASRWPAIVAHAKSLNASLGVALSTTELSLEGGVAALKVKYPFHKDRLEKPENRLTIDTAFATILGFRVPWEVRVTETASTNSHPPIINQALEALGGKLVPNES